MSLGRHSGDYVTSFYTWNPSGFMVEYGWGGQVIDDSTWKPFERKHGPSLWGHDRKWMSPEKREEARQLCIESAEVGLRQPVQVIEGNYNRMPGVCPWWDQMKAQKGLRARWRRSMKAGVASPNGVVIADVPQPKPKPTDILVKIKAIALNRADLGSAKGDTSHGAATGKPIGSEFSGEVVEVGSEVRDFKVGDRVMCHSPGSHAESR